ncbi:beta-ketoacyl-ACP synthase III [Streptomyces harbinensis]
MRKTAVMAGIGGYLPSTVVTNAELASSLETSDTWIRSRTGISSRRRVGPGEATSDLAVAAGQAALASGDTGERGADMLILATSTPDHPCPATAPEVAHRLGLGHIPAFDIAAVCSGFVYGLAVADGVIAAGTAERVLLIGADCFSTIVDPADRTTAAVFGDGAGAVLLRAGEPHEPGAVQAHHLGADGELADLITRRSDGSGRPEPAAGPPADQWFRMQGRPVYRHAVRRIGEAARAAADAASWAITDVDHFVAHQANARILATVGTELGIAPELVHVTLAETGNTVAASIPLALADVAAHGKAQPGDRVLLAAFGGGATWGATALTWPEGITTPATERSSHA